MVEIHQKQIDANLKKLASQSKKYSRKAVAKGAEAVAQKLKENTPFGTSRSDRKWKAQREIDKFHGVKSTFSHLADDIQIGNMTQFGTMEVGFGDQTYWRAHFVEKGTIRQKPQAFMERTSHETRNEYVKIVENVLRKELKL